MEDILSTEEIKAAAECLKETIDRMDKEKNNPISNDMMWENAFEHCLKDSWELTRNIMIIVSCPVEAKHVLDHFVDFSERKLGVQRVRQYIKGDTYKTDTLYVRMVGFDDEDIGRGINVHYFIFGSKNAQRTHEKMILCMRNTTFITLDRDGDAS